MRSPSELMTRGIYGWKICLSGRIRKRIRAFNAHNEEYRERQRKAKKEAKEREQAIWHKYFYNPAGPKYVKSIKP